MRVLLGRMFLVVGSSISSLQIYGPVLFWLACRVSVEKSIDNLMGILFHVICCSPLFLLIFYLCVSFLSVWLLCVSVGSSLGLSYLGLCSCWTWLTISFPLLGKFSAIISSNFFLGPFLSLLLSGTPIMWILVHLMLPQRSLRLSSFFFLILLFSYILFRVSDFHHSVFQVTYSSSASTILLMRGPGACKMLFVSSRNKVYFPQFCGNPVIKSLWLSKSVSWGFLISLPDPKVSKPDTGLRIFTKVGELL